MNERQGADKWLRSTLGANAGVAALVGTRIYAGKAPEHATYPFIVFAALPGGQVTHAAGQTNRILGRLRYSIRAVVEGASFAAADAIANALDAAIVVQASSITVGAQTYAVLGCWQEQPLAYDEVDDGKEFRHVGGIYTVDIHPT